MDKEKIVKTTSGIFEGGKTALVEFKQKNDLWNVIGILTGILAIIVGIWFLKQRFFEPASLESMTFGADFYTEIYKASRRIHGMLTNINDFIEYVKKGFGWSFIFFGLVDICVFASKLQLPEKNVITVEEPIAEITNAESVENN